MISPLLGNLTGISCHLDITLSGGHENGMYGAKAIDEWFFEARAARAAFGTVGSRLRLPGSTTGIHGPFIQNAQSKIVI
jgi:hypothetical protein